jgi:hypothetical protein
LKRRLAPLTAPLNARCPHCAGELDVAVGPTAGAVGVCGHCDEPIGVQGRELRALRYADLSPTDRDRVDRARRVLARLRGARRVPPSRCLTCRSEVDAASPITKDQHPAPGDVAFCFTCGGAAKFDDGLRLVPLGPEDMTPGLEAELAGLRARLAAGRRERAD